MDERMRDGLLDLIEQAIRRRFVLGMSDAGLPAYGDGGARS